MAAVPNDSRIDIDGETFDLVSIPNAKSNMVQNAKGSLLGSLDLQSLVDDLDKLGKFIRVAYNGVAGNTDAQIKVQRIGYTITKLADKSAVTVHKFKETSHSILQELKGTYEYLLDGLEEMALETLSLLTAKAEAMAKAADELHNEFEMAENDVRDTLEDIQRAKTKQATQKKRACKKRKDHEIDKQQAKELQKSLLEAEAKATALRCDAQDSIMKTLASAFTGVLGAAESAAVLDLRKATEKMDRIGDKTGYKEAMKMANKEKMKHLEDMLMLRDLRHEANRDCIKFAEKITSCKDDDALAEAAIEGLHSSAGALRSLSAIMMSAAVFWRQTQSHCESLAKGSMQQSVQMAMKYPEEKRLKTWTSRTFKERAVRYYSKWVALDDVCGVYMLQIRNTRQDLYKYLEENPTVEQAKKNVRQLASDFAKDLKQA